jgi:Putative peptidoglycan binding domain
MAECPFSRAYAGSPAAGANSSGLRCCLHLSVSSGRKLLSVACVLLVCGSFGFARTKKTSGHTSGRASASSTHSRKVTVSAKSGRAGKKSTKAGRSKKGSKKVSVHTATRRGQQAIDGGRAVEIQQALIKANYLQGEPSGVWDQQTRQAMSRFQSDNGWQNKVVPDSRALIKLGLGPNHSDVINPETSLVMPHTTDTARQMEPGGASSQH